MTWMSWHVAVLAAMALVPGSADGNRSPSNASVDATGTTPSPASPALVVEPDGKLAFDSDVDGVAVSLQSDGCTQRSWLICGPVQLRVATPSMPAQAITLDQVVLPASDASNVLHRGPLPTGVAGAGSLLFTDIDGDGHEDLMVRTGFDGTYGDPSYTWFLFDPVSRRLVEQPALAELLAGHSVSRVGEGRVEIWYRSGPCDRGEKTVDVRGGAPAVVASRDYDGCEQSSP